jgi:hypothetical protein
LPNNDQESHVHWPGVPFRIKDFMFHHPLGSALSASVKLTSQVFFCQFMADLFICE